MKDHHSLSENMLTVNMLLSVFFLPGVFADRCGGHPHNFLITTPKSIEGLSGSCLQVPCSFTINNGEEKFNRGEQTSAAWIPSNKNIFDISKGVNNHQINITGNIKEKNCTTVFSDLKTINETEYFLRVESGEYKATACSTPLQITVKDSPDKPRIETDLKDLKEHQSVTVTCSAFTPCPNSPPELTWNLQQDSLRHTEKNRDGTFTTKIQENITLLDTHDGYNIRCSARYPVIGGIKTAETEVTLSVSYAPRNTSASISPSGLVSAGSWVELSCSSRAKPPPRFTWFRISEHGDINVSVGPIYKLQVTNMTDLGSYYCEAKNILGSQTSTWSRLKDHGMKTNALWGAAAGGFIAIIIVICGACILWRLKFKHSAFRQSENSGFKESTSAAENQDVHYGDIDFSAMRPSLKRARDETDHQSVMYSEVKVCRAGNGTESVDGLYAQVKTKPVSLHVVQ